MKTPLILIVTILFSIFLIHNVIASEYSDCNKECIKNASNSLKACNDDYNICNSESNIALKSCNILSGNEKYSCIKEAKDKKNICNNDKKACLKQKAESLSLCKKKCGFIGKNITCLGGLYSAGDIFLNDCNKCECNSNGKISCKTTEYCNLDKNIVKNSSLCSNGLFQKLCAGSIMSTKCSQEIFCQCGGNMNYSCDNESICLYDFALNNKAGFQFSQGWIRFPDYKKIGDVGICVKKPNILTCGNSICENVCNGTNCSVAETSINCPNDCD